MPNSARLKRLSLRMSFDIRPGTGAGAGYGAAAEYVFAVSENGFSSMATDQEMNDSIIAYSGTHIAKAFKTISGSVGTNISVVFSDINYSFTPGKKYFIRANVAAPRGEGYGTMKPFFTAGNTYEQESSSSVWIRSATEWIAGTPHVWNGSAWLPAQVFVFNGSSWVAGG